MILSSFIAGAICMAAVMIVVCKIRAIDETPEWVKKATRDHHCKGDDA